MENPIDPLYEKIVKECQKAGASSWDVLKVLKELKKEESQDLVKLRKKAITALKEINPVAAETYSAFDKLSVYTSSQTIEPFDRGNIVKSLLKETKISRKLSEKIGSEVEENFKDLKIAFLNASLIRSLTGAKLLYYDREDLYWEYTRVGLPIFDIQQQLLKNPGVKNTILIEYALQTLPKKNRIKHYSCDLHISKLEDYSTKLFSKILEIPKLKSKKNFVSETLEEFSLNETYFTKAPVFNHLNLFVSNLIHKKFFESKELAKILCSFFDSLYVREKIKPSINFDLFIPTNMEEYRTYKEKAIEFINDFLDEFHKYARNFNVSIRVETEFELKLINEELCKNITILNCSKKSYFSINENFYQKEKSISTYIGINLMKFILDSCKNEELFFERLDETIKSIKEIVKLKKELMQQKSYIQENNISLNKFTPCIGLDSLTIAAKEMYESIEDRNSFIEKIIKKINSLISCEICLFNDAEGKKRFSSFNKKKYNFRSEAKDVLKNPTQFINENINSFQYAKTKEDAVKLIHEKNPTVILK